MIEVDIEEAQAHLKDYIAKVKSGERVVFCDGATDKFELRAVKQRLVSQLKDLVEPIGETPAEFLARHKKHNNLPPLNTPRVIGSGVGQMEILPSFYDPLPDDELALWNCDAEAGEDEKK